jgi:hypothetical protein
MLNVLSIAPYQYLPPQMGGQKCIALFYKYLSAHVNLTCVTTANNKAGLSFVKEYEVMPVLSNSSLRYMNPFYFFKLRKIIKERKITHLIIEHPYYGWLALLLKWFCKVKLIIHSHNIEALRFKSTGKWWWGVLWNYERYVHRKADLNFFIQDNDLQYAIDKFKLESAVCIVITYGVELQQRLPDIEKKQAKDILLQQYNIPLDTKILLFNGTLNYKPNEDALNIILEKINPILLANIDYAYKIVIAGSKLPEKYNRLEEYATSNIIYAGFVDDIDLYLKGADILINPVIDGGGIKTKVVEALGFDMNVVSTISGAIGVPESITGNKMIIVNDNDNNAFGTAIISSNSFNHVPDVFFDYFYWGKIAKKAAEAINSISSSDK